MAFCGGVTHGIFIPGFSLNVARRSLSQTHPTHKNFLHALTANRKPPPQLVFAASMFAWYQTVTRDTHSMSITRILLHDGQHSQPTISSPLNQQAWIRNFENDHDRDFIIDGITNGFQIIPSDSVLSKAEISNYKSATP